MKLPFVPCILGLALGLSGTLGAFDIQFNYTYDSRGFFSDPVKKQVLETAGAAWEAKLAGVQMPGIPVGTGGNTWSLKFNRPDTAASFGSQNTSVVNKALPANTVVIYVGGRPDVYGGYLGYAEFGYSAWGSSAWLNQILGRNTGSRFCSFGGAVAFDSDAAWHFDVEPATKESFPGLVDFYTIAMHEIGHLLGFNSGSAAFNRLSLGGKFAGERTAALYGEKPAVLTSGHWPLGLDFGRKGLVMGSHTTTDARVELNSLDVEVLRDLGYVATGSIKVVLGPDSAVGAGARWTVDGGGERASGVVVSSLSEGEHTIGFEAVPGFFTPEPQVVTVESGKTLEVTGHYVPVPVPKVGMVSESLLVEMGAEARLEVAADGGGAPLSYVWKRGGKLLSGVQTASYLLKPVQLSQGGAYGVEVKSTGGGSGVRAINLGVVCDVVGPEIVNEDAPIALTQSATGPDLQFQWFFGDVPLVDDAVQGVTGAGTPTLRIRKGKATDAGSYQCRVRMPDAAGGQTREFFGPVKRLAVRMRPVVDDLVLGPWRVSGTVTDVITAQNGPVQFRVSGLPVGVVLNRLDGRLSGRPRVAKTYRLAVSASNEAGSSPVRYFDVECVGIEERGIGVYAGLVERTEWNGGLGGSLSFAATTGGVISGSLSMGVESRSFRGAWESFPGPDLTSVIELSRGRGVTPWVLHLGLDVATGLVTGKVCQGVEVLAGVRGWQSDWSVNERPASEYQGMYTAAIAPPGVAEGGGLVQGVPEGVGYASMSVTAAGLVTLSGKLGDGTTLTRSLRLGVEGDVPLHSLLYRGAGSVQGWLTIRPAQTVNQASEVDGQWSWVKQGQGASDAGIPLHELTVTGGSYRVGVPVVDQLGLGTSSPNTQLSFDGGWEGEVVDDGYFDVLLGISDVNRIQGPDTGENPAMVRLSSLSVNTGLFRGDFVQAETGKRVLYYGMLIPRLQRGAGWFFRTQPGSAGLATIQSGRVILQRN